MFWLRFVLFAIVMGCARLAACQVVFEVDKGSINFYSNAPNEVIKAVSEELKGVLNTEKKQFAFKIEVGSFKGFNSPLQQDHFNENYMETGKYPDVSFSGKIIEDVDLSADGKYTVRAKGRLNVHGISRDRIIYAKVSVKDKKLELVSEFNVALADHDIKIPRIVNDKLATEVTVIIKALLVTRPQ